MCSGKVTEGRGERDRGEEKWVEEQGLMVIVTEGRDRGNGPSVTAEARGREARGNVQLSGEPLKFLKFRFQYRIDSYIFSLINDLGYDPAEWAGSVVTPKRSA